MAQELEVDRDLINPNFNSYRLSPDVKFSIESKPIGGLDDHNDERLQTLELGNNDYSYSHVAMATTINNLCWDPRNPSNVYFITSLGRVMGAFTRKDDSCQFDIRHLFTIPNYIEKKCYASLSFPSSQIAIILLSTRHSESNFSTNIFVVNRNPESGTESWSCDATDPGSNSSISLSNDQLFQNLSQFTQSSHVYLFDSILVSSFGTTSSGTSFSGTVPESKIYLIFGSVNENSQQSSSSSSANFKSRFCSILHWIILERVSSSSSSSWNWKLYRRLIEAGLRSDWPKYVALYQDTDLVNLVVASEGRMKFDLVDVVTNGEDCSKMMLVEDSIDSDKEKLFKFSQTSDEVLLRMELGDESAKSSLNIDVDIRPKLLKISLKSSKINGLIDDKFDEIILSGELEHTIITDGSNWSISNDSKGSIYILEIILEKCSKGLQWKGTVVDPGKEESTVMKNCSIIPDSGLEANIVSVNLEQTTADNGNGTNEESMQFTDGLEDCDKDDFYTSLILSCFEGESGKVIQEYDLSSQKWLFTLPSFSSNDLSSNPNHCNNLPFIVMRHDVDAFVYQPKISVSQFSMKHLATFDALGYIQASKTNKSFMTLSQTLDQNHSSNMVTFPNALIADSIRNVYLYWLDRCNKSLNDRNSGSQYICNLGERCGSIHGLYSVPALPLEKNSSVDPGSKQPNAAFYVLSKDYLFLVKF